MSYCSEQLAMRARARAALHRLTNLATARGWSQWTEYADARAEALRKVRMAVGRARNALVAAAFGAFALFLQDVLAKKAKARADADQMLLRIMNREVWLGFRCFDQVWQAAKVERKMRKAVGRMRHRHQSRALMCWRHEYYAYKVGLGIINREMTALGTGEDASRTQRPGGFTTHAFTSLTPPRSRYSAAQVARDLRAVVARHALLRHVDAPRHAVPAVRLARPIAPPRAARPAPAVRHVTRTGAQLSPTHHRPTSPLQVRRAPPRLLRAPAVPARVVDGRRRRALRQARRPPPRLRKDRRRRRPPRVA